MLLKKKNYESDITQFIRGLLQEKPQIVDEQKKGQSAVVGSQARP